MHLALPGKTFPRQTGRRPRTVAHFILALRRFVLAATLCIRKNSQTKARQRIAPKSSEAPLFVGAAESSEVAISGRSLKLLWLRISQSLSGSEGSRKGVQPPRSGQVLELAWVRTDASTDPQTTQRPRGPSTAPLSLQAENAQITKCDAIKQEYCLT